MAESLSKQIKSQKVVRLGDIAPDFSAKSSLGDFSLYKYFGDGWGILFSHPHDFTPVCTTELIAVCRLKNEWEKRGVKPVAYSIDDGESHLKWIADIEQIGQCRLSFPIIDGSDKSVAVLYGMLDPDELDARGSPTTVRSVFIVDPKKKVRLIMTYPASTGRSFEEILRCIDSLQLADEKKLATPADWEVGDEAVILPNVGEEEAKALFPGHRTIRPYLRYTRE